MRHPLCRRTSGPAGHLWTRMRGVDTLARLIVLVCAVCVYVCTLSDCYSTPLLLQRRPAETCVMRRLVPQGVRACVHVHPGDWRGDASRVGCGRMTEGRSDWQRICMGIDSAPCRRAWIRTLGFWQAGSLGRRGRRVGRKRAQTRAARVFAQGRDFPTWLNQDWPPKGVPTATIGRWRGFCAVHTYRTDVMRGLPSGVSPLACVLFLSCTAARGVCERAIGRGWT